MTKPTPEQIDRLLHGSPMPRHQIEHMGRSYKRLDGFFWGNWTAGKPGLTERQLWMLWCLGAWSHGACSNSQIVQDKLPEWAVGLGWDEKPAKD